MIDGFAFEGGQVTARQLAKRVTAYSEAMLQTALENGCQNVPDVMAYLARRDARVQARTLAAARRGKATTDAKLGQLRVGRGN